MKVRNDGSVVVFTPENDDDSLWADNLPLENWQWLAIDHRLAGSLIEAAITDGIEVAL